MILADDKTAVMEQADFDALPEYSCSVPTGQTIGKRWKRARNTWNGDAGWLMGSYEERVPVHPDFILTMFREIVVVS